MVRLGRLIVGLLVIPLVDAFLLIVVATQIGWVLTVAIVVLTALLGMLFVRAEGRHTIRKLQRSVAEGKQPTEEILDGGLLLVAGAFLLTPGLVTDAIGFLIVFPPTRYLIRRGLMRYVLGPYIDEKTGGFVSGEVYTFGFPDQEQTDAGFSFDPTESPDDATQVDFEDVRDADGDGPNENP